uniref:Retrovirus-related Pol polyprotein from transposon TNT 1-94 n=1 Tax=Cajanus cajan TaxID=3821 RepID=A0A151SLL4_CAJCA|nr:Retrovirus-related Pol polyprotein from transposon TNT 1-94 [Cajanus cajan]
MTTTQLPIKLNSSNYPAWYRQIHSLLEGYVTGDTSCPPKTIPTDSGVSSNPSYNFWIRQDKYLYIALLGSCNTEAYAIMAIVETSRAAWLSLERAFAARSRSRVMSLKERLNSSTKGSSTVIAYLQSIRSIAEDLSLIIHAVDDIDLVIHTLNGLDPSFREFTTSIRTRDTPISFDELSIKLLDYEMYLKRDEHFNHQPSITANYVNQGRFHRSNKGRNNNHSSSSSTSLGKRNNSSSNSDIVCQLCSKKGHGAQTCYKFTKNNKQSSNPVAYATHATTPPPEWLFNSGASHHITNDLNNLSLTSTYTGNDKLYVANGMSLPITHVGSTTLHPPTRPLSFTNVLYAPGITQNLISVSQLCNTNDVSIEFFPSFFEVKDLSMGANLLRGPKDDHVYKLPLTSKTHHVYSTTSTSSSQRWHTRLGHPSSRVLHHVL